MWGILSSTSLALTILGEALQHEASLVVAVLHAMWS